METYVIHILQILKYSIFTTLICANDVFYIQLGLGFVVAEATLSTKSEVSKLFYECKGFVMSTCQSSTLIEKVDDLCQVSSRDWN